MLGSAAVMLGFTTVMLGSTTVMLGSTTVMLGSAVVLLDSAGVMLGSAVVMPSRKAGTVAQGAVLADRIPAMLQPGLTYEATYAVTPEMRPPHVEGILATSRMIGLMEDTCLAAVQPLLAANETTVGTRVDVTHVGTAWTGEEIRIRIVLAKITQRRLLSFEIEIEAPAGIISTGTHQRLVVDRSRFARRE